MRKVIIDSFTKEELSKIVSECRSYAEVIDRLGYKTKNGRNHDTVRGRISSYGISTSHFGVVERVERNEGNVFCKDSTATQKVLRHWYLRGNYSRYECSICGQQPVWFGKSLTMILDHIDGNNKNNELNNLRWVCPNCDKQLETYKKSRNKKPLEN